MTRAEAIKAVEASLWNMMRGGNPGLNDRARASVEALEALGLIKFDEPTKTVIPRDVIADVTVTEPLWRKSLKGNPDYTAQVVGQFYAQKIINALEDAGWMIVSRSTGYPGSEGARTVPRYPHETSNT